MARISYVTFDGSRFDIEVEDGWNLMEGAVKNAVPGIDGDCGGSCACATCHVHVAPEWFDATGVPGEMEAEMLAMADNASSTSRLACQIEASPALDGLLLHIPESQH